MKKNLKEKYKNINSIDIEFENNKIKYKEKNYSEDEWLKNICSFKKINENEIKLVKNEIDELPSTILSFFQSNINKMSFLGLILPCIVFLVFSLISFTTGIILQNNLNFEKCAKMVIFIGFIYLFLSIGLLMELILGEKVYLTLISNQTRLKRVSKKQYKYYIECLNKNAKNEFYYFQPIQKEVNNYNIVLREFKIEDDIELFNSFNNPKVYKFLLGEHQKSIEDAQNFIKECIKNYKNKQIFKIAIMINNQLIGYIGLSKQDLSINTCQIIYAIGEKYWGNGYVVEAINLFIPYLKKIGKETIYAGHVQENEKSGKVLIKSGFFRDPDRDTIMKIHGNEKNILSYLYGIDKSLNLTKESLNDEIEKD